MITYKEVFNLAISKGYTCMFYEGKDNFTEEGQLLEASRCQKWLRDEHKIKVISLHSISGKDNYEIRKWNYDNDRGEWERIGHIQSFDTYEETLLEETLLEGTYQVLKLI